MDLDTIAIVISIIALIFSYTSIVFSKHLELKVRKFDELILNEIQLKFRSIDKLFEESKDDLVSGHLASITDTSVEIVLYLVTAQELFKRLDINEIQNELQEFSDKLYLNPMKTVSEFQSDYARHKMKTIGLIYDQSMRSHTRFLSLLSRF